MALFSLVLCAGCSSAPRGEVEGTVRSDGRPLQNVLVTFLPDEATQGKKAAGVTDGQGRYHLQSEDGRPGVVAGSYRVVVEDLAINAAPRDHEGTVLQMPPRRFSAAYTSLLQTPLRKSVEVGRQQIDLDLRGAR